MTYAFRKLRSAGSWRACQNISALSVLLGVGCLGSVQAAQLSCGPGSSPLRIHTAKATWTADGRYVSDPTGPAAPWWMTINGLDGLTKQRPITLPLPARCPGRH